MTPSTFFSNTQTLMSAMGTLGGSNFIFPRLYRHMFVVAVDSFEDSTIIRIFTAIGDWHFAKGYPEKVALLSRVCTKSQPTHTHTEPTIHTCSSSNNNCSRYNRNAYTLSGGISSRGFSCSRFFFLARFQTMAHNKIKMAYFITSFRKSSTGHVHAVFVVVVCALSRYFNILCICLSVSVSSCRA